MDVVAAIEARRSIRAFQNKIIPKDTIARMLELSTKAPSGKNRQPWRFAVLQGNKKEELAKVMHNAITQLKQSNKDTGSCELSIHTIREAPVVILVFNGFSKAEKGYRHYTLLMDIQSIGAAVQNLLLAAQDFGLGTCWICDVFYCPEEICSWLNRQDELVAAVAIGYPNESPAPRPSRLVPEVTTWLD
ncbi:5,6-dimethylbenzimidazole synthase [Sporotomaculum syntrophicum]|uniref:5,6-dimethylbenzimidazole synthase n=1 Tax=Sporotomaculum syntrophicum TaxID=182264 RepID=A0A9D2WSR3_9FIRM|nr:nitroreductase [Sporotomaculum syntrophicum]KAF1086689.1 5,6-dimethylbenzimidazole synthase [Sporotomaculum syntrophicum]